MIKTVLFDYAGVISPTKNNYIFSLKNSRRFGLSPKKLMQITYENWAETTVGKQKCSVFWDQIAHKLNIEPEKLKKLIINTFPIDKKIVQVIKRTKKTT